MAGLRENVDAIIGRTAAAQHGAVARRQLLEAGLSSWMIDERIRRGMLLPVFRGVYLIALGPSSPLGLKAAAVLACGPRALLSHLTAGHLWGLSGKRRPNIELTVVGRSRKSPRGVDVHFISSLAPSELRRHERIPITSPSLTLLDLAGVLDPRDLAIALNEARIQRLVSDRELRATIRRHPRRAGARRLRKLLDSERGPRITRSVAEAKALAVMRAYGIEPDASDVTIGPYRLDFLFRRERLVVEIDGYRYHATPKRFVDDRRRTAFLASRGFQLFPLTWRDLHGDAQRAMQLLRQTLDERRRQFAA